MKCGLGVAVIVVGFGCSSPRNATPDAAGADGSDSATCTGDSDGDGHCNEQDTCPDVADPAQVDLDKDGLGWACDPVESVSFTTTFSPMQVASVSRSKVASVVEHSCGVNGRCEYVLFAASDSGALVVRSNTTDPAESWANAQQFSQAVITSDGQVLFSRRETSTQADTLAVDLATKTAVPRAPSMIASVLRSGTGQPLLLALRQWTAPAQLVEPRNGNELAVVDSGTNVVWFTTNYAVAPFDSDYVATEGEPFISRTIAGSTDSDLYRFKPGSSSLAALDPPVAGALYVRRLEHGLGARWCVTKGGTTKYYEPTPSGVRVVSLPHYACPTTPSNLGRPTFELPGTSVIVGPGRLPDSSQTAVFVRNGVVYPVFEDQSFFSVEAVGSDVVAVIATQYQREIPGAVWAIWPDNSVELLANDLSNVNVAVGGGTIHVIGVKAGGTSQGPLVVRRFRKGAALQEAQLKATEFADRKLYVVTSAEGAAIAGTDFQTWIASSSTFSFALASELYAVGGGARGNNTVVFSKSSSSIAGAVFAFDEVAGVPRLTRLTPDENSFRARLLEPDPAHPSEYFAFGAWCNIGRIVVGTNGTPQLESIACGNRNIQDLALTGVTPQGEVVIDNSRGLTATGLYALGSGGVRPIAESTAVYPVVDQTVRPPVLVAWASATGHACMQEQPLRCWSTPPNASLIDSRIENGDVSMVLYDRVGDTSRLTVVRSIGPGNVTPP